MCNSSQLQLSAGHLLCLVMQSNSFSVGILLGKFVEEESLKSFLEGREQNVQQGDTMFTLIALREVSSDKH